MNGILIVRQYHARVVLCMYMRVYASWTGVFITTHVKSESPSCYFCHPIRTAS